MRIHRCEIERKYGSNVKQENAKLIGSRIENFFRSTSWEGCSNKQKGQEPRKS